MASAALSFPPERLRICRGAIKLGWLLRSLNFSVMSWFAFWCGRCLPEYFLARPVGSLVRSREVEPTSEVEGCDLAGDGSETHRVLSSDPRPRAEAQSRALSLRRLRG